MRRAAATFLAALLVAGPALADPAPATNDTAAKPKTKRVCRADASENPLFPTMHCRVVPVENARADAKPAARPAATQVALDQPRQPQ